MSDCSFEIHGSCVQFMNVSVPKGFIRGMCSLLSVKQIDFSSLVVFVCMRLITNWDSGFTLLFNTTPLTIPRLHTP